MSQSHGGFGAQGFLASLAAQHGPIEPLALLAAVAFSTGASFSHLTWGARSIGLV
jgi:hypothetical protein